MSNIINFNDKTKVTAVPEEDISGHYMQDLLTELDKLKDSIQHIHIIGTLNTGQFILSSSSVDQRDIVFDLEFAKHLIMNDQFE